MNNKLWKLVWGRDHTTRGLPQLNPDKTELILLAVRNCYMVFPALFQWIFLALSFSQPRKFIPWCHFWLHYLLITFHQSANLPIIICMNFAGSWGASVSHKLHGSKVHLHGKQFCILCPHTVELPTCSGVHWTYSKLLLKQAWA
jgi:hypothetical protein